MKISDLIRQQSEPFCSLEFFPPKNQEQWPAFYAMAARLKKANPLFVSITYGAGGSTQDNTLEIATRLRQDLNFETLVHLTCVNSSREKIRAFMKKLEQAGIQNVLALRGDAPAGEDFDWSSSEFHHASDLVTFVRQNFPDFCVGVAGYPHPHPESISFKIDRHFTRQKIMAGAGLVITQLIFDNREYFDFADALKDLNIDVPVLPGVLPIISLESLRRTLAMCGANLPAQLYFAMEEANEQGGAAAVREAGIEFAIEQCAALLKAGAKGVHLYTLNQAETCLRIVGELRSRGLLP